MPYLILQAKYSIVNKGFNIFSVCLFYRRVNPYLRDKGLCIGILYGCQAEVRR